jgi:hypothetical protein
VAVARDDSDWRDDVEQLCWPGTAVTEAGAGEAALAGLRLAAAQGAHAAAVVAGDCPDLPGLLLGKVFRALGSAELAACPATDGGLVAVAVRLPVPAWWGDAAVDLDAALPQPAAILQAVPDGVLVAEAPGWHRLRGPADVHRLDPGLEGWASTRALLSVPAQDVSRSSDGGAQ